MIVESKSKPSEIMRRYQAILASRYGVTVVLINA